MRPMCHRHSIGQTSHCNIRAVGVYRSSNANRMCCELGKYVIVIILNFQSTNTDNTRAIHLRLLLYRPMFTQLCSDERASSSRRSDADPGDRGIGAPAEKNLIYSSVFSKCAASCVLAAIDLVSLVHQTYRTSVTDAWWYNGFCKWSHWCTC